MILVMFMARGKRIKSETGIYHVMLRGINKQEVFHNDEDYYKFLSILSICKAISGFTLHAYCLMNSHVHLLIQEGNEPLELVFKRIGDRFIYWYNLKYCRTGPLFQGRYKSKPVNDDAYFISALRYIHQNPVKAGLTENCKSYQFSSYNAYFKPNSLVDTDFALELTGIDEFKRIHTELCEDQHLDIKVETEIKPTDEEAQKTFEKITLCKTQEDFQKYPKDMQIEFVVALKKQKFSIRQICLFTGVSKRFIYEI